MQKWLTRYTAFYIIIGLTALFLLLSLFRSASWLWLAIPGLALCIQGLVDITQTRHAIRRNYPVIGNLRFIFEAIRPEIRQYFLEGDEQQLPFSRADRSLVYQRAKQEIDKQPFGTHQEVYNNGYEWINHSMTPKHIKDSQFRIDVGGPDCTKPYSLSVLNISAMSFGALSANAILALNKGAKMGNFAHDTGEGGISTYHLRHGGDLIWNIGSGYFGCRDEHGNFSPERFAERATQDHVKMIEIKLSQGAKPGHGGILPGTKVSPEIALARGVPEGVDCNSPASHSAFHSPVELLEFVARLRTLSGGKPVGFKLCIGHPWEWFAIAKAMLKTGITPDFIVVDGAEGGTGASPVEFIDHVGTPLREALRLVHNTLVGIGLREQIRLGASGKIISAFDMARIMALGADWCNSARGFMFAVGCIQAQACHTDKCPTGVATQDPQRQKALVVDDKSLRVASFHGNTLKALAELLGAAGLEHPDQLRPHHIARRISNGEVRVMSALFPDLKKGELLRGHYRQTIFRVGWPMANPDSFEPAYSLSKALSHLNDEADPEDIVKKQDAADSAGQALA
ncbi:FMN-binding glutamate synthase family protein [Alcaligenes faecalis]|jgi:glutamate synthase domain-containing protein 2|uniref:FMN-binding glutamate synthase family protein n=2 Tax=Alcaligenes faecalis TaxID=511 RepID=A0A0M7GQ54_ALCFA|nr:MULTISPECIES: FMN-binding glutamate synthase family protein [Alcaligenes]ALO39654.1 glutamate synthase [Alcaligenes faecalis]ATH99229.1 FMN-binding glutamate synthase family protein [Alcaligenes faecalis]AYZ92016.1 FMN-binding glutamate synthase family protein [Alcaligenes faecalis]KAA1286669.1 FMN-binding glutamate synthase family protein [Alcaligenes faecalis]MBQ0217385.1 FMN-binding glutamate synthase family protein [Alcaligenes faecalis]